jgi:hypothetical protein
MPKGKTEEEKKFADEPLLTPEETWNVLEFSRAMSTAYGQNYLNPFQVNERLRDINLNPLQATQDSLDSAMKSPKNSEDNIRAFSEDFEIRSMPYKRLLTYLSNMLSFDITYTSTAEPDDYETPKYKKDLRAVETFLDKFEYKKELRIATREMLRNDAYFACFRDVGDKYVLQELPSDYCKITGRWEGGYLFSFNMYWFLMPGTSIDMYPDFFRKKYKEIWVDSNTTGKYNPALAPEAREKSQWIFWVDVPVDVGVCFKLTEELATRLPYFTPIFNDLLLQPLIRNLQKNINMAEASKIIIGEIPMLNRDAKAAVKDSVAISPDLLGKFMALVKSAISDAVKMASAPLTNMQGINFTGDNEMYNSYLRTALASAGINTNLIFSSNIKPNAIETQLSLNVDEQLMTVLYDQFALFMNYWLNKFTRTFKFQLEFEGTDFFLDRTARFENAMTLFDKGIVLPQKIAAAIGMKPAQLRKHMEESAAWDFVHLLTAPSFIEQQEMANTNFKNQQQIAKISTQKVPAVAPSAPQNPVTPKKSTTATSGGRPKKPLSKLGDEGLATRDQATNVGRGGKVR